MLLYNIDARGSKRDENVNWNEKFRLYKRVENFKFFLTSVAGNVDIFDRFVNDFRTLSIQVIDNVVNGFFVPWDWAC